jgi:hypothetical protein
VTSAEQIKHWLARVATGRLAMARILADEDQVAGVDWYDVKRAASFLEDAFAAGLEAHGQAVLKEYLAETDKTTAA